ncbi:MAG: dihydrolipoamide acetyltransferase family protein [Chloroflexota bacterium]|nr:dihydrolipoamide acetyltransferase family protein [Chloroflexota bacterium]
MPTEIYMMKLGMTMTEGTVAEWHIPDGGEVKLGEDLYRLETEKVEMEVEAEAAGIVRHLVPAEATVDPGAVVGWIYAADEEIPDVLPGGGAPAAAAAPAEAEPAAAAAAAPAAPARAEGERVPASPAARRLAKELGVDLDTVTATGPRGRVTEDDVRTAHEAAAAAPAAAPAGAPAPASPLARKRAEALGVDLSTVTGTGPGGRITKEDVEAAAAGGAPAAAPAAATAPAAAREDEVMAVRGMRKVIAERMYASLQETAQLTMDMDVAMDDCVKLRSQLIEEWAGDSVRPSYTDIVMKAAAKALLDHPRMNAQFLGTEMNLRGEVHVGMAVALDEGLVVPVVRHVDQLGLKEIALESSRLAGLAREGKLGLDDMAGGTFTVSTLGMFGVDSFTPILNPPEVGILGVNRLRDDVRWEGERPVRQKAMTLSLTWDHRALDGAPAAQFLASVRDYLEAPFRLLV